MFLAEVFDVTTLRPFQLLSPISPIEVGTVRCVGLNYRDHARECGLPIPTTPVTFLKPGTAVGHPGASVSVPAIAQKDELDWEVELAVVIGKEAKDVSEEEAADCVLGYTVANDVRSTTPCCARPLVSVDDLPSFLACFSSLLARCRTQSRSGASPSVRPAVLLVSVRHTRLIFGSFVRSQPAFDGFCPLGPVLVAARQVPNMDDVRLKTTVNDVAKQDGSASELIFSIPKCALPIPARDTYNC